MSSTRRLAASLLTTVASMTALTVPVAEATAADPNAVIAVAPGGYHTCALLRDGRVKCWGSSMYGQLGYGDTDNRGDNTGVMGDNLPAVDLGTGRRAKAITSRDRKSTRLNSSH